MHQKKDEPTSGTQKHSPCIQKEDEVSLLHDEILKQIEWQQPLFLAIFFGGSTFLSLGLQPGLSGLTVMILPIAALALAVKLGAHDLRAGQINFYLRYVLRSPWETIRRILFNGNDATADERRLLAEQGITLPEDLVQKARKLKAPVLATHAVANRLAFLTMEIGALGIGVIRTFPAALHYDPLTIFVWILSVSATVLTMLVLRRKRVR